MATKKNPEPEPDETEDLLNELGSTADDETGDLLDEVPETDAEPWMPEDAGEGIEGVVVEVREDPDQFNDDDTVPVLTVRDNDGELHSIAGFRGVLRKEIRRLDPQPGDRFAVKYLGTREVKRGQFKGSDAHVYRAAVRKAQPA